MTDPKLADAILAAFGPGDMFIADDTGEKFQAITETDLMQRLREKGWRLPRAGFFMSEVREAGFKVTQGYQFKGKVRRYHADYRAPSVSDSQTLIHL